MCSQDLHEPGGLIETLSKAGKPVTLSRKMIRSRICSFEKHKPREPVSPIILGLTSSLEKIQNFERTVCLPFVSPLGYVALLFMFNN